MMKQYIAVLLLAVSVSWTTSVHALPNLWVSDASGTLGTVDVATGNVSVIGNMGVTMTDLAFDPSGNLYGISFTDLYQINATNGQASLVGSLGLTGANALVFGTDSTLYAAADNTTNLYSINALTGTATSLGSTGFSSAGDLAFNGGNLFLSSTTNQLVQVGLNPVSGTAVGPFGVSVFGLGTELVNGGNGILYGISGTQILTINTTTGAATALVDYGGNGIGASFGAAFFSESGAGTPPPPPPPGTVPEPMSLLLLGSALVGMATWKRYNN